MSSTKKNNNFFFGAKAHIGVDAKSGLIHTIHFTTAKVSDRKKKWRSEGKFWGITDKRTTTKALSSSQKKRNKKLSSLRSKVEHPFGVMKNQWKHRTVRYRGLGKNTAQWFMLATLHNLYKMRRQLAVQPL